MIYAETNFVAEQTLSENETQLIVRLLHAQARRIDSF